MSYMDDAKAAVLKQREWRDEHTSADWSPLEALELDILAAEPAIAEHHRKEAERERDEERRLAASYRAIAVHNCELYDQARNDERSKVEAAFLRELSNRGVIDGDLVHTSAIRAALKASTEDEGGDGDLRTKRINEAHERLAPALGRFRCDDDRDEGIERDLEAALDRLKRVLIGEDYIERAETLREKSDGAYHFTPPLPESQPQQEEQTSPEEGK